MFFSPYPEAGARAMWIIRSLGHCFWNQLRYAIHSKLVDGLDHITVVDLFKSPPYPALLVLLGLEGEYSLSPLARTATPLGCGVMFSSESVDLRALKIRVRSWG